MNKWGLTLAACVSLIAGCAGVQQQSGPPDPASPKVFVSKSGKIVIDQSPIRIEPQRSADGKVNISWSLPEGDLTFPENGVQIRPVPTREQGQPAPFSPVICGKTSYSGVPDVRITAVELDPKLRSTRLQDLSCRVTQAGKGFQCSFTPPEGRYVFKYSIYVCQGDKLIDAYDPFIMN